MVSSLLGFRSERDGYIAVVPLAGRYIPVPGDEVIGRVAMIGPSFWLMEINSPYMAPLHVTESPWRVETGDAKRYMDIGELATLRVTQIDENRRVQVTMKDRDLRHITSGQVMEVSPAKIPRVIGRKGSMVTLIKRHTNTRMFVGQNGRIWVEGEPQDAEVVRRILRLIEEDAHALGLTESVRGALEQEYGKTIETT